ncbi:hypothetical protein R1flu_024117 [Riccia fluitans]|uniref:Replitron HUH endonuclease domain-containing protein n=1 Tax=Riccia fluitans TaxID=41844 RepID=A0ABD1XTZ1_9MARC
MAVLALKRGDSFLQLHLQGMVRVKTSSMRILKREIKEVIGWQSNGPVGASMCLKSLHYKGLHAVIGLIGYCLKDEGVPHFKFYNKNVSEEQKAKGHRMHSIYRASEYKHKLELTPANIIGKALQFCKLRAERIWRAYTSPEFVEVPDVEAMFFGVETTTRYFETQEQKTSAGDQDANIDEDQDADDDGELTENDCQIKTGARSASIDNPRQTTKSDGPPSRIL